MQPFFSPPRRTTAGRGGWPAARAISSVRDETAVRRANRIVVDARGTASKECGDLLPLVEKGVLHWERLPELGEVVAGRVPGRTTREEITLFESQGMGIQDVYVGARLLAIARERGVGVDLPIG